MFRLLVATLLIASPLSTTAADLSVNSSVSAVTVFPSTAEVTRNAEIAVAAGAQTIVIQDLPPSVAENSVRVEGDMSGDVEITSVDTNQIFVKLPSARDFTDESERRRLETELERLRDERAGVDGIIEGANTQKLLAQNLAKLPISTPPNGQTPATSPDWNGLFDLIGSRFSAIQKSILDAQIRQRELDKRIRELEERLNREPPEETERTEVRIFLEAKTAAKGQVRITYRVAQAGWQPAYDARVATDFKNGDPSLALIRRASVTQDTGEDWENIALKLSTARPGETTAAPDIRPVQVAFRPDARPASAAAPAPTAMQEFRAQPLAKDQDRSLAADAAAPEPAKPILQTTAGIESSAYQAVFTIPAKVTVKTGKGEKKVVISQENLKPVLKVVTVPKESTAAYLNAQFTYNGEAPILPGEVALYRDNVFIGTGVFPLVAAGEEHNLGFGADDAVKVNRISVKREKGESGLLTASNTDEQHFRISVKNLHPRPMPVTVIDRMPYSEDEKIIIEMLPMTTQPVETNYDDKRGVLAWDMDLKPGEEKQISVSYQMTWPAKRDVISVER